MPINQYCLGFLFNRIGRRVLLIRKERPEWQKGRWNGIGGKINTAELPCRAMERECLEEAGLHILADSWAHFCTFAGSDYAVHCFKCFSGQVELAESKTDELCLVHDVEHAILYGQALNHRVKWLILMALSSSHETAGWYEVLDRAKDESPALYTDCFEKFSALSRTNLDAP